MTQQYRLGFPEQVLGFEDICISSSNKSRPLGHSRYCTLAIVRYLLDGAAAKRVNDSCAGLGEGTRR